jgi:hypothetical protein
MHLKKIALITFFCALTRLGFSQKLTTLEDLKLNQQINNDGEFQLKRGIRNIKSDSTLVVIDSTKFYSSSILKTISKTKIKNIKIITDEKSNSVIKHIIYITTKPN